MKKIFLMFAVATAALGFTSCDETWDDNPVLKGHEGTITADFLNAPVMQNQMIMLTDDNKDGTFHLTCSQPDFGYAAVATYKVQCSLTEDFAVYQEISQDFYDCSQINPVNGDVAAAIEYLSDVKTDADLPLGYQKLYMRLRAFVAQSEDNTQYLSNVVSFKGVAADYLAIWVADQPVNIYLRGSMNNWGDSGLDAEWQFLTGDEENTWYISNVTIPAGSEFKVADNAWDAINLGGGGDNTIVPGEEFALSGGDNITINVAFTGSVHLRLDKGNYTLILDPAN